MNFLPYVLLIVALALFLLSTNQWKLWLRGLIVAGGFILLVGAAIAGGHANDIWYSLTHFGSNPDGSTIQDHWDQNQKEIGGYILSMLGLFVVLGVILGLAALVAFLPGETEERIIRPIMIGLVGAVLGGVLASFIIGIGLNSPDIRPVQTALHAEDVVSGDRIHLRQNGGLRPVVHLDGIDAPEMGQFCWGRARRPSDCGELARRHLVEIVEHAGLLSCTPGIDDSQSVVCVTTGTDHTSIAARMLSEGYALRQRDNAPHPDAKHEFRGLLAQCSVAPSEWRRMTDGPNGSRTAFGIHPARRLASRVLFNNPDTDGICPPARGENPPQQQLTPWNGPPH